MDLTTLRTWCEQAGITGADLDTALTSWTTHPTGADGIRVQRVIEVRHNRTT